MIIIPASTSPPTTLTVSQTAHAALRAGISCIPIVADGTKRPAVRWKVYQRRLPTPAEVRHWFAGKKCGIAFLTGAISGGLEMLDFDTHAIYAQFAARMQQEGLAWFLEGITRGYQEQSPKGVHLYYRCPGVREGNTKVAQRPLKAPPYVVSLIETRGEGGYSIGFPSPAAVHPSGHPYRLVQGALATIQTITPAERALLLSVARTLDELPPAEKTARRAQTIVQPRQEGRQPGTIFNEQASWPAILEPHGWTWVRRIGEEDFWCRPGKRLGISATTNYEGAGYLYVFSTSTLFEPCMGISKFAAYTFLEHGGNFADSTRALVAQGYVEPARPASARSRPSNRPSRPS